VQAVDLPVFDADGLLGVVAEGRRTHADTIARRFTELGPELRQYLSLPVLDTNGLLDLIARREAYAAAVRGLLTSVDLLATPTTHAPAPALTEIAARAGSGAPPIFFVLGACTLPFSLAHVPALSVPCGFTPAGLPVGLQIVGRPFDEATVLRVGHAYERAAGWYAARPPVVDQGRITSVAA